MNAEAAVDARGTGLRSPVAWALLGLVIQRSGYGYGLVHRFERAYGEALPLSSPSQVYASLDALERRAMVEQFVPDTVPAGGRQPKPHYRATARGVHGYREWLVGQAQDRRRRSQLFVYQLAMLPAVEAVAVLAQLERAYLADAAASSGGIAEEPEGLAGRLLLEQDRLAAQSQLAWIEYARRELAVPGGGSPEAGP